MYKAVQQLLHYYYYTSIWIYMEWKGVSQMSCLTHYETLNFDLKNDLALNFWIFKVNFSSRI